MTLPDGDELLNRGLRRRRFRAVLFDFDGTLSLLREGWPEIMVGMMVEILREFELAHEPRAELERRVEDFVLELNGQPTRVQMERFADEVRRRGGFPSNPDVYGGEYARRLMAVVGERRQSLQSRRAAAIEWVVPHAHRLLKELRLRDVAMYLASGSQVAHVRYEAELLEVAEFFAGRIYAPSDESSDFSKRQVIDNLLAIERIASSELLGFGDGVVETQEVRRVGGLAVAVASRPKGEKGIHAGKRDRLAAAGADMVIADYREPERLLAWLFGE